MNIHIIAAFRTVLLSNLHYLLGSIMGRLLFIITMNDIGNVSDFLYSILYADDTSVLLNRKYCSDLNKLLNSELDKLSNWLSAKSYHLLLRRPIIWHFTELSLK